MCCDNLGVITNINNQLDHHMTQNHTIAEEYDIYKTIQTMVTALAPIIPRFIHVLGHQDTCKDKKPLMLEARLNIECNAAATKMHNKLIPSQYPREHPFIPGSHP